MKRYRELLESKLMEAGWEIAGRDGASVWWLAEWWHIRLLERNRDQNRNLSLYILFLVDPQYEGENKSAAIRNIMAAKELPEERPIHFDAVAELGMMKGRFDRKLEVFIHSLNSYREEGDSGNPAES